MGVVRELLFLSKNKQNHIQDELFEGCSKGFALALSRCQGNSLKIVENQRKQQNSGKSADEHPNLKFRQHFNIFQHFQHFSTCPTFCHQFYSFHIGFYKKMCFYWFGLVFKLNGRRRSDQPG